MLELEPLPGEETARLALAAAGEVALSEDCGRGARERSGGNPLFVRELVAASPEPTAASRRCRRRSRR